jgi:hypothetical protein
MSTRKRQITFLGSKAWPVRRTCYRRLSAKLAPTLADRGCHVVSTTHPHSRILGFLDRIRYYCFQVAPQLYSRGWVDPVPEPLLPRKCGKAGNRTRAYWSVVKNTDQYTTEAVNCTHEAEWTPFQTHYFSENLVGPEIEPGPLDL